MISVIATNAEDLRLGYLRKHSVYEIPQLGDVLKGDMGPVGPRSHPLDGDARYNLDQLRRSDAQPWGGQVFGR
jgi:lipopolysaccharide/colanic/teichoic acid biosynthesis glycosyltransferase